MCIVIAMIPTTALAETESTPCTVTTQDEKRYTISSGSGGSAYTVTVDLDIDPLYSEIKSVTIEEASFSINEKNASVHNTMWISLKVAYDENVSNTMAGFTSSTGTPVYGVADMNAPGGNNLDHGNLTAYGVTVPADVVTGNDSVTITLSGTISYEVNDGALTLTGTGPMPDFSQNYNVPWYDAANALKYIVSAAVGEGITTIGERCFHTSQLTSVSLPATLEEIHAFAFINAANAVSEPAALQIPSGVTYIAGTAFRNCRAEISADGGNYYTDEEGVLFHAESGEITLVKYPVTAAAETYLVPEYVDILGDEAFYGNPNLKTVIMPGVKIIGTSVFNTGVIKTAVVSNQLTAVGNASFGNQGEKTVYFCGTQDEWASLRDSVDTANVTFKDAGRHGSSGTLYVTDGGSFGKEADFSADVPAEPEKDGCIFQEWEQQTQKITENNQPKVQTYLAKWTECPHEARTFAAGGAVMTAACAVCGHVCGTAVISAPENLIADGGKKEAVVVYSDGWSDGELEITYAPCDPVDAGAYTASIEKGGAAASVDFTLNPALTPIDPDSKAAAYQVEHYKEELDGGYTLADRDFPLYYELGAVVDAEPRIYAGYTLDEENENAVPSGTVTLPEPGGDGQPVILTLKLYYKLKEYTVAFDSDGGSAVDSQAVKHGGRAEKPSNPTKSGYTFGGWYLNGAAFDFGAAITDDVTLTAQWSRRASGGSSGGSASSGYAVSVGGTKNGSVSISPRNAGKGGTVTITATPDKGYEVGQVTVTGKDGKTIKVTAGENGRYTFTMPASKVEVEVTFTKTEERPAHAFTDVPGGYWAENEIAWAYENGYMNGSTASAFDPSGAVTRQQLWMILARLSGFDPATMAEARNWAVTGGVSDGAAPGKAVSRQQLVTILYRFAALMGYDVSGAAGLTEFPDHASVAAYADGAMRWSVANGIVGGTAQGTLDPGGTATRAQFAAILHRFCEKTVK